jgi:hypothetical protein
MVKPTERLALLNSQSMILPEKCWTDLNYIWHYKRLKKYISLGQHKKKTKFLNERKRARGKYILRQQSKMASHEDTWGATVILKFDTRWWWAVTKQLYPGRKTRDTLNRMLGGPERQSAGFGEKYHILPGNESRFWSCSVCRVVTITNGLSRLKH